MTRLAVSIGCPAGIGPEVSVVAAVGSKHKVLLVGDLGVLAAAAKLRSIDPSRLVRVASAREGWELQRSWQIPVLEPHSVKVVKPGHPSKEDGAAQLAWIDAATDLVAKGDADALVTGPVSKDAIARSGVRGAKGFLGHTEHIARRLKASEVTMAFHVERLTTSLVTTHIALADVAAAITKAEVARAIYWTCDFLRKLGAKKPVAVAALNPHAGEGGLLGEEEESEIAPGIELARKRLGPIPMVIEGPIAAETAFRRASKGVYSAVVAMYHDQATIPMKLLAFGDAVNVTLGLPIIRTSVDHGTAYDLAGKGKAEARGMTEAMGLAAKLVQRASSSAIDDSGASPRRKSLRPAR
jgi:4-hydroxythreonine-4-phosphate dehydrogenase